MSLYNRLISQYNRLMSLYNRLTETGPQSQQKKNFFLRGGFRPLPNKNVQFWNHFFPELFPKDSESLKILDIRLREVGAKCASKYTTRKGTDTHRDRQTDTQTDRRTLRLLDRIGPMGRFDEKYQLKPDNTKLQQKAPILIRNYSYWPNVPILTRLLPLRLNNSSLDSKVPQCGIPGSYVLHHTAVTAPPRT